MRCLLAVVVFLFTGLCFGQQYVAEQFEYQNGKLPYRILFPDQNDEKKDYPLLLVLHGAGERGLTINHNFFMAVRHFKLPLFDPNTPP